MSADKFFRSINREKIERDGAVWFVTNTIPAQFPCSIDEFKKILERYFARLMRAWGDRLSVYWAIETTLAQQWHLHMIMIWVKDPPVERERWEAFRDWNDLAWHQATRVPDAAHLKAGCRIEKARSWRGVIKYLSGYLSPKKWAHYTGGDTGRVHGCRNAHLLPIKADEVELSPRAQSLLRRAIAKIRSKRGSGVWCIWLNEDGSVKHRIRQPGHERRPVDSVRERREVKALAEIGMRLPNVRFKRTRKRFFRNEVEWADEFEVRKDGREVHVGVVPLRRYSQAEIDRMPRKRRLLVSAGDAAPSWAFGPRELHLPWAEVSRLIQWAVSEDRRRSEIESGLPF